MPLEHREVIAMNIVKTNPPSLVPRSAPSLFMDLERTVKPTLRSLTPFETSIDAKQTKDSLLIREPVPWTRLVNWKVKLAWSHMLGNGGNLEGTLSNGGSCSCAPQLSVTTCSWGPKPATSQVSQESRNPHCYVKLKFLPFRRLGKHWPSNLEANSARIPSGSQVVNPSSYWGETGHTFLILTQGLFSTISQTFNRNILCSKNYMLGESEIRSVVSDSLPPHALYSSWNSPGQNTGGGSLSPLQGIFPTQGSSVGLPHCRWILYQLSQQGSLGTGNQKENRTFYLPSRNWQSSIYIRELWRASPAAQLVKNSPAIQETLVRFLGPEDPLEKGEATHSSVVGLPWCSAGKESACNAGNLSSILGLGRSLGEGKGYPLQSSDLDNSIEYAVAKSQTALSNFHFHFSWRI